MRTLIRGGWIVGYQNGRHAILREGVVVFEDERIVHVGRHFDGTVERIIDATGKLVAPGFVNLHSVANLDIQTLALDVDELGFASSRAYAVDGRGDLELSGERLHTSARFSLLQALKYSSTTIVESTTMAPSRFEVARQEAPALVEAAKELGVRLYVSHKFRAGKRYLDHEGLWRYHWDDAAAQAGLAYGKEIVHRYEGAQHDRIRTMLFPYQFDACPPELLRDVKAAGRELGVPVHMHTAQTLSEFHACRSHYNCTPVQLLDRIGFLDERTILTHLLYTTLHPAAGFPTGDDSDLRIVAERGATVVHCPVVYARRDRILDSFARYRSRGINVALGTDTYPQDMIEEMRWAALGCKWQDREAGHGAAAEVFNAATLDGAKTLGRDDIGRLAPGAKADIIIVDFTRQHIGPVDDPIKTLVYVANGTDVETVIVDGEVVIENGRAPGMDEAGLIAGAKAAHLWQRDQFVAQHPTGRPVDELFATAYRESLQ